MDLKKTLMQHELWLKSDGSQGERADLSGAYLAGVNLSNANLGVNLSNANLIGTVLELSLIHI